MSDQLPSPESVLTLLARHASCRRYRPDPVPEDQLASLFSSAQRAATSSNLQLWSAIVVQDAQRREELARLCGDQAHIRQAPVFLAWCADRHRLEVAAALRGYQQQTGTVEAFLVAAVDAAIAMQNATVAAEAMGLGTCYIGGLRNSTADVIELLRLPQHVFPIAGMTVGYPQDPPRIRPRLDPSAVVHYEHYREPDPAELERYDRAMRDTGIYEGRQVAGQRPDGSAAGELDPGDYGWLEHSARRVSTPPRPGLGAVVRAQGFPLA